MTDDGSADFDVVLAAEPAAEPLPPAAPRVSPPDPGRPTGWRSDPAWQLVSWDETYFNARPADLPPRQAELAQPDSWASLYAGSGRIVATWSRVRY